MHHYGFSREQSIVSFSWGFLKEARDKYIARLNAIYESSMESNKITSIIGTASLPDTKNSEINGMKQIIVTAEGSTNPVSYTAKHVLIATGAYPAFPEGEGIMEHSISSDGFFELEDLPRKTVIVGAGYIGVELAGVLRSLGTDVSLVVRNKMILKEQDKMISETLEEEMKKQKIKIYKETGGVLSISLDENGDKIVNLKNGEVITGADCVIMAIGRKPSVDSLNLKQAGVKQKISGHIIVNDYADTNVNGIYALGDVCGKVELTPMVSKKILILLHSCVISQFPFFYEIIGYSCWQKAR